MNKTHNYKIELEWSGNLGTGTSTYTAYSRDFHLSVKDKPVIQGSSDPTFRGNPKRYNPEEMLLAALASCHMLWYLHLCAESGIVVTEYSDYAEGVMMEGNDGVGHFVEVTLYPKIKLTNASHIELALELHHKANKFCYIANSCNFPVKHLPVFY